MDKRELSELLDLAVGTPDVGTVNFNVLHRVLQFIIEELDRIQKRLEEKVPVVEDNVIETSSEESPPQSTNEDQGESEGYGVKHEDLIELFTRVKNLEDAFIEFTMNRHDSNGKQAKYDEKEKEEKDSVYEEKRNEFEDSINDMGDAISRLADKLRKQDEKAEHSKLEAMREVTVSLKIFTDQLSDRQYKFEKRLRELASAVRNMQIFVNEVNYPESPGISKCLACGRSAHLPQVDLLRWSSGDIPGNARRVGNYKLEQPEKKDDEKKDNLQFTQLSLKKLEREIAPIMNNRASDDESTTSSNANKETDYKMLFSRHVNQLYNLDDAQRQFLPIRMIPEPDRGNKLERDAWNTDKQTKNADHVELPDSVTKRHMFKRV